MSLKSLATALAAHNVVGRIVIAPAKPAKPTKLFKQIEQLCKSRNEGYDAEDVKTLYDLVKDNSKLTVIRKAFPRLSYGTEYASVENKAGHELEIAYLNAGDLYATTLARNPITKKLEVTSLGDLIDYLERKGYHAI